ncbi:MAG: ATP-binding protein, partial [Azospirillaceae bacterium]
MAPAEADGAGGGAGRPEGAGGGEHRPGAAGGSLRRRLLLGAAAWIALALLLAGLMIAWLLTDAVESQVNDGLEAEVDRLVAALQAAPDGGLAVVPRPPDPAYARPYSGRYWQVGLAERTDADGVLARSRSLWDRVLDLPDDTLLDGTLHRHGALGPRGRPVVVVERAVVPAGFDARVRVAVAVERAAITAITRPAIATLAAALAILAVGLMVAAWLQVGAGLRPLERLRGAVARIGRGEAEALGGRWPAEVAPLAAELDAVLASNRHIARTARRQAADMAHALKTRLAVAANEADALRAVDPQAAGRLADELVAARRLLERHLARARAGGPRRGGG